MKHKERDKTIFDELQQYRDLFTHHVEAVLKSRLLLDEDCNLLLNYWDESCVSNGTSTKNWEIFTGCLAVAGLITSVKLNSYVPSILSVPFLTRLCHKGYRSYYNYKVKENFENLIKCLRNLHELNRAVLSYFRKRSSVLGSYRTTSCGNFMNYFYCILLMTLEDIKENVLTLSEKVPAIESCNLYVTNWDLEAFKTNDFNDYEKTLMQLDKMCDYYILMVSNFLSCIGLGLCVSLCRNVARSNFKVIFDEIVPSTLRSLDKTVDELSSQFKQVRHTLEDRSEKYKANDVDIDKVPSQLSRPLEDFLSHLQITFEIGKHIENGLKAGLGSDLASLSNLITEMCYQYNVCDGDLNRFVKNYEIIVKRRIGNKIERDVSIEEQQFEESEVQEVSTELRSELLVPEDGQDEEYNLYVGFSDEEDNQAPVSDYVDQMPTEYLELMLQELKKKLDERKRLKQKPTSAEDENENKVLFVRKMANCDIESKREQLKFEVSTHGGPPPPPPLLSLGEDTPPPLPPKRCKPKEVPMESKEDATFENRHLNESQVGFLNSIKTLAKQLNREEETFGFGDVSSGSESEED